MNANKKIERLELIASQQPTEIAIPAEPVSEEPQLARELAGAFEELLKRYKRARLAEQPLPELHEKPDRHLLECLAEKSDEQFTFHDMEVMARHDPDASKARWEQVKAASQADLDSGWTAARVLEPMGGSAWERAGFKAVRARLRESWPPRNAGEGMLIDELAQYEMLRRKWLGILARQTDRPHTILALADPEHAHEKQKLSSAESCREALRMVERLERLYQSTLKTLLNIRRQKPAMLIQKPGQVNLTLGPQLNVSLPNDEQ